MRRGVLIAESIWPNDAYPDGSGINTLTGADAIAPYGGAAFHDNKVWIRARLTAALAQRNSAPTRSAVRGEIAAEAAVIDGVEPQRVGHLGRQRRAGVGAEVAFPIAGHGCGRLTPVVSTI